MNAKRKRTQESIKCFLRQYQDATAQEIALGLPYHISTIRRNLRAMDKANEIYHIGERPKVWYLKERQP